MNIGTSLMRLLASLFLITIFSTSCTSRKSETPRVSLQLGSQNGALSGGTVGVVIVNFKDKVFEWDCEDNPCDVIDFELDAPDNGLLQLLVVIDGTDNVSRINYGDVGVNLKGGDNFISIPVSEVGAFTNEAHVVGRYVPSNSHPVPALRGKYLTGELEVSVSVGTNKPDMKILKNEIYGGWFNIFVLDTIGFKYKFSGHDQSGNSYDSVPVFNDLHDVNGLDLDSAGIQISGNERVKFDSTESYFEERDGQFELRNFNPSIVGFFGQNPSNNQLCADYLAANTEFNGDGEMGHICKGHDGSQCNAWFEWSDIVSSSSNTNGDGDTCNGAPSNYMEVNINRLGEGGNGLVERHGPFAELPPQGLDKIIHLDTMTHMLSWSVGANVYLPGGVELFLNPTTTNFNDEDIRDDHDGFDCSLLPGMGFSSQGVMGANRGNRTDVDVGANFVTALNAGMGAFAICPLKPNGEYYSHALVYDNFNTGGAQGPAPSHVEFEIYLSDFSTLAPGFNFGGTNWNGTSPYIFEPIDSPNVQEMYLVIRNKLDEQVFISGVNTLGSIAGFSIIPSPGSTPMGYPTCGAAGFTLAAEDGAATNNDLCAVRIDFSASTYGPGDSVHNEVHISSYPTAMASNVTHFGFPIIGQVWTSFDPYMTNSTINLWAPPGKFDAKAIRFKNNDPATNWTHDLPASGGTAGDYTIYHNCPATIAFGGSNCMVQFVLDNVDGSKTSGTAVFAAYDFGFAQNTLSSTYFAGPLDVSEGNPYDFGDVTANTNHNFTITNNTGSGGLNIGTTTINGGTHYSLSAGTTDCLTSPTLASATACDFDIDVTFSSGFGLDQAWLDMSYEVQGTSRLLSFEVHADHQ